MSSWVWPTIRNPSCSLQTLLVQLGEIRLQANDDFCYLSHNCPFLGNGLTLVNFSSTFDVTKQREPPCINLLKNAFCDSCSNKILDSLMGSFSKVQSNCNKDPNLKPFFFFITSVGRAILEWSILSWIIQSYSSLDWVDSSLQM
jgi:hypothetical protein